MVSLASTELADTVVSKAAGTRGSVRRTSAPTNQFDGSKTALQEGNEVGITVSIEVIPT